MFYLTPFPGQRDEISAELRDKHSFYQLYCSELGSNRESWTYRYHVCHISISEIDLRADRFRAFDPLLVGHAVHIPVDQFKGKMGNGLGEHITWISENLQGPWSFRTTMPSLDWDDPIFELHFADADETLLFSMKFDSGIT